MSDITTNKPPPFERQPSESAKAFAAFETYARLESKRSLAAVGQALGKSVGLLERWSRKYQWVERARAYDYHLAAVERQAAESRAVAKAEERMRRRDELLEQEWAIHEDCMRAGKEALKRFHENSRRGAPLGDVSRIVETGSKMGRLSTGLATDHTEITGENGGPVQLELAAALNKVYGEVLTVTGDRRAGPPLDDGQMPLLPRGDCTDSLAPPPAALALAEKNPPLPDTP